MWRSRVEGFWARAPAWTDKSSLPRRVLPDCITRDKRRDQAAAGRPSGSARRRRRTPMKRMVAYWMRKRLSLRSDRVDGHEGRPGDDVEVKATTATRLSAAERNIRPAQTKPKTKPRSGTQILRAPGQIAIHPARLEHHRADDDVDQAGLDHHEARIVGDQRERRRSRSPAPDSATASRRSASCARTRQAIWPTPNSIPATMPMGTLLDASAGTFVGHQQHDQKDERRGQIEQQDAGGLQEGLHRMLLLARAGRRAWRGRTARPARRRRRRGRGRAAPRVCDGMKSRASTMVAAIT